MAMNPSLMLEAMEGMTWAQVRLATECGDTMILMHFHRALVEFSRARACEAVMRAMEWRKGR